MSGRLWEKFILFSKLVKPEDQIANVLGFLAGVVLAVNILPLNVNFFAALVSACTSLMAANTLNQYCEVDLDRLNKPDRPLPSGKTSESTAVRIVVILYLMSLLSASILGVAYLLVASTATCLGILYSVKPFKLKDRFVLSNMTIALGYGVVNFFLGWCAFKPIVQAPWGIVAFLFFFDLFANISKDYGDIRGDEAYGMRTIPVVLGRDTAIRMQFCALYMVFIYASLLTIAHILPYGFVIALIGAGVTILAHYWVKLGKDSFCYASLMLLYIAIRVGLIVPSIVHTAILGT